ncbi:MAG TPA: MbcA/ParS/Xre antitoxin family protein [Rhodospirillales bacterium]|nr:MbcA/ParS/Xre antitoxin family protein [Rhodospirillales bacterium]
MPFAQEEVMALLKRIETEPRPFAAEPITDEEAAAMFRAALNLFRLWGVTDEQAGSLLDLPRRTFARWKAGHAGRIGRDGKARLSNLMGIHKALRLIFTEAPRGYAWIKAPNDAFGGRSALDVMLGGDLTDLMRVRRYLDAERGGW